MRYFPALFVFAISVACPIDAAKAPGMLEAETVRQATRTAMQVLGISRSEEAVDPTVSRGVDLLIHGGDARVPDSAWSTLAGLRSRAATLDPDRAEPLRRLIVVRYLEGERWKDAAAAILELAGPSGTGDEDRFVGALRAAVRADLSSAIDALSRCLSSRSDEKEEDLVLTWTALVREHREGLTGAAPPEPPPSMGFAPQVPMNEVVLPELRRRVKPRYPEDARRARVEGEVSVAAIILSTGHVAFPRILRTASPLLDDAAIVATARSRYTPGTAAGKPFSLPFTMSVRFRLSDDVPGASR